MAGPKKNDVIDKIMAAINKGFGGAAQRLSKGAKSDVKEAIPSGLETLDRYVLGCGGWPVGRISEVFSEEGGGKTSLLLAALANVQRIGGIAIMCETEVALDSKRALDFGVDLDRVILLQPGHLDEATRQIELTLESIPADAGPVLIGWDSVAATQSKEEALDGLPDKDSFDKRAKAISQAMRVLSPLVARSRTHLMLINQVRANIGVLFGDKHVTPGGKAIKFHASIRLQLFSGKAQKDPAGQHVGKDVIAVAVKNKLVRPYRKSRLRLMYDTGWDDEWTTRNHAKELKLIGGRDRPKLEDLRRQLDAIEWHKVGAAVATPGVDADPEDPDDDGDDGDTLDPEGL
jgi:recombination protein RecA